MGSGSRSGRQLLAVIALVCAIGGLVLAAGALPTLASDSPASGVFEGATDGQSSGEPTASSAAATGSAASGSSGTSGLDSDLMAGLADSPLFSGLLSNLLGGSAGGQPRPDVDDASMDDLEGSGDGGTQSDGPSGETGSTDGSDGTGSTDGSGETGSIDGSGETGSTDGSGETGSTDGSGETSSTDGSDETGSTDSSGETGSTDGSDGTGSTDGSGETDSSGEDSTDGGGETGSGSGGTDGGQSTSEGEVGGTDGQTSAARGEDGSDDGVDESEADDGSGSEDSDGGEDGDDSSLTDSVPGFSDRAVTAGLVAIAALIVGYVFYTRDDPIGTLLAIPGRLVSLALAGVVACSQALERALAALRGLRSIADLPGLVLATIADAIRSARTRAREVGSSVSTSLFGGAEAATDTDTVADAQTGARERIRRAFESVIDASPMYRTRVATATPGDVARSATDAGAPGEPVETITDSFRDVEYGDRDPDAYLERTTTAHDRLRDAMEAADETDDGGRDSSGDPDE